MVFSCSGGYFTYYRKVSAKSEDLPNLHADFESTCVRISQKVVDGVLRKWYFLVQEVILHIIPKFERNRKGSLNLHANLHAPSNLHICRYLKKLWTAFLVNGMFVYRRSRLTRALLGLWISHRLLGGGGGVWTPPPPMISAPGRRREKPKAAFESSRKIISKSFRSFFGSGQNWGLQGSKFQNFPKRFFDNNIFNFKNRTTNLIPSCLSR